MVRRTPGILRSGVACPRWSGLCRPLTSLSLIATAFATADSSKQTLVDDSSTSVPNGTTVGGSTGAKSGVRDDQDGTDPTFGTTTFASSRRNSDGYTPVGDTMTTSVGHPTYPNVAHFPNPATVNWVDATATPISEGGGGE